MPSGATANQLTFDLFSTTALGTGFTSTPAAHRVQRLGLLSRLRHRPCCVSNHVGSRRRSTPAGISSSSATGRWRRHGGSGRSRISRRSASRTRSVRQAVRRRKTNSFVSFASPGSARAISPIPVSCDQARPASGRAGKQSAPISDGRRRRRIRGARALHAIRPLHARMAGALDLASLDPDGLSGRDASSNRASALVSSWLSCRTPCASTRARPASS